MNRKSQIQGKNPCRVNILSFDVEEWFQVENFEKYIPISEWEYTESRVEIGVDFILEALHSLNVKGAFFLVGWVAKRHPAMVERIVEDGHEIGIHGYSHKKIFDQSRADFTRDLEKAMKVIGDITDKPVKGYRAPSYTITHETVWALDILQEFGFEYDSSIYPINGHPTYGFANIPRTPFRLKNGLYEFPMSTVKIGPKVIPFGSGGYFRLFPYFFTRMCMRILNRKGMSLTVNIHPWELDPDQMSSEIGWIDRFRHYTNISGNRKKFIKFLSHFKFSTFEEFIKFNDFPWIEV